MKANQLFPLAAAMLLLASCGGNNNNNSSQAASQSSQESQSSSAAVESSKDESLPTESSISSESVEEISSSEAPKVYYDVTFSWNFDGAPEASVVSVEEGALVVAPEAIAREGYVLSGWYLDAAAENAYDFSTPVTAALTLYAGWIVYDENTISCTFYWNYEGANPEIYTTVYFTKGKRMTAPADPVREGYNFRGWYQDADCTTEFVVNSRYNESVVAYAKWFAVYTFEAEYTQFTDLPETDRTANEYGDKIGHGYSSDVSGTGLIFKDDSHADCKASNGYYVCDLYYSGAYLEFVVTADREVFDAVLIARLSAEYFDMNFVPSSENQSNWDGSGTPNSGYDFEVNGETLDYSKIVLGDVITGRDNPKKRDFTNHTISTSLHLVEGKNSIKLITKNSHRHDSTGTMAAMAPMVDCIYTYTDAALSFQTFDNI